MSQLPDRLPQPAPSSRQLQRAAKVQSQAELALFEHSVAARLRAEADRIDSQAAADAFRSALGEEIQFLQMGRQLAGRDPIAVELLARKLSLLSSLNTERLTRRFSA